MEVGQRPNSQLRLQRRLRGWSQEDVAAGLHRLAASQGEPELGVDATMVSRWERGTRRPRPRYVRLLCRLFELPAEQLGVVDEETFDALEDHAVERRDFIQNIAALLGAAALPMGQEPWDRLALALRRSGPVDEATVDHLEQITVALQRLGPAGVSAPAILGPVNGHLDAIGALLKGSLTPDVRARLCSLAAETAGYGGWLRWDLDDPSGSASYFATGLQAAREAGDRALVAYLAGSAACQPPYRETPRRRLEKLRAVNWSDATPSSRVWLAAKEADASALMGDADGCLRALDRAQAALAGAPGEDGSRRPRFTMVSERWLDGERGASLARLGRTGAARAILEPILAGRGPASERDHLWLGAALAGTYVRDGEPEEACRVAGDVLERASRMQLRPVLRLLADIRRQLDDDGAIAAVRELDQRLRETTAASVLA